MPENLSMAIGGEEALAPRETLLAWDEVLCRRSSAEEPAQIPLWHGQSLLRELGALLHLAQVM